MTPSVSPASSTVFPPCTSSCNDGGLGILVGDGMLPHPGLEQIVETYYSYALTSATRLAVDYQFIANPGYNTDRGPASVVSGRLHWQF